MLWWQQTRTFHAPRGRDVSTGELVHTINTGKPEITVEKWNGLCHSIWDSWENMGCDLRWCNVVCSADLDILHTCTLWRLFFHHCLFLYMYKISTHVVCVNGKHPGYTLNLLMWPSISFHATSVLRIWRHQVTIFHNNWAISHPLDQVDSYGQ